MGLDVAYGLLEGVAHSSPSGGRRRGELGGTQNCTLVRSVCLRRSRRPGLRHLIWWSRTFRPKLRRRTSRSSTGHSQWRSRRGSREILLALCPRRDALASLLMLLCRENPVDYVRRSPSGSRSCSTPIACHPVGRLQIVCVVEYSPPNAGLKVEVRHRLW